MKIIILGAGELGRLLAERLCDGTNDVTVVDTSSSGFERLREKLDLMVVEGRAADVEVLKQAGIRNADIVLAVSGDEAANIIACQLAAFFGVKKTICRLYSFHSFSPKDNISPALFGIWRAFSSPDECVRKIREVLPNRAVLEKIRFSSPSASMEIINISPSSLLAGTRVKDIPANSSLSTVRFAALVRGQQFLFPHGDTIIVPGDKVYIAGQRDSVSSFVDWAAGSEKADNMRVIISGASNVGQQLARQLLSEGFDVRVIESDSGKGARLLDTLPPGSMVLSGETTDEGVMLEAGIDQCDAFISTEDDDENSILSCILAKRLGAKKVIAVTHKPEYIAIVPTMEVIDCAFNSTLVSVNTIFRLMESGTFRIDAKLQRFHAHLTEFKVTQRSPLVGKALVDCGLPPSAVLAMLFRGLEVISPMGSTVFQAGDTLVAIVTPESARELEPFFPR